MTLDVYGVGNTLADIQVQISDSLLESLGFAKGMMTLVDQPTQQRVLEALGDVPRNQCAGGSAGENHLGGWGHPGPQRPEWGRPRGPRPPGLGDPARGLPHPARGRVYRAP